MKNTGVLFANDAHADRCKAVIANLHRMGVTNAVVSAMDGRKFTKVMTGFDRVLVDAPCSGSGVVSKDEHVKTSKDEKDILRCSHLQKELLLTAIDCVDAHSSAGIIVYSTCSVLPEENECVVEYAVKHRNVEIIETGLNFGREGLPRYREHRFNPGMALARRFYPHTHNMEGFFVCKLRKRSNQLPAHETPKVSTETSNVKVSSKKQSPGKGAAAKAAATKKLGGSPGKRRPQKKGKPVKKTATPKKQTGSAGQAFEKRKKVAAIHTTKRLSKRMKK